MDISESQIKVAYELYKIDMEHITDILTDYAKLLGKEAINTTLGNIRCNIEKRLDSHQISE